MSRTTKQWPPLSQTTTRLLLAVTPPTDCVAGHWAGGAVAVPEDASLCIDGELAVRVAVAVRPCVGWPQAVRRTVATARISSHLTRIAL